MANGSIVLVNGKVIGIIKAWNAERQAYLVEIAESGVHQFIAEKYLTA
jgi:hypothetical protein